MKNLIQRLWSKKVFRMLVPSGVLIVLLLIVGFVLSILDKDIFWPGYVSMILFYAAIFFIGTYVAAKKSGSNTIDEMMLADRSIPLWIAIFTMSATWIGGGYINGTAEAAAEFGIVWAQAPWGYALSLIFGGLFFARKMRRYEFKTMLDPLSQRFGKKIAGILFLPALSGEIFWTAAILTALGTTFGTVLGVDFSTAIIISACIAIIYTMIGGLWAVAITDVFQMILIILGLGIVLFSAMGNVGGWDIVWPQYKSNMGEMVNLFPPLNGWKDPSWGNYYWNWWDYALLLVCGGIPWQVYFQRVLSSKDEKTAMFLSFFAGIVCILVAIPAMLIGVIGNVVDWSLFGTSAPADAALTLPYVARYLTNPFVSTIGLGAIAAAVMSSVDSSVLSASSLAAWNVYKPLVKPKISSADLLKVVKRCILIIGVVATILALRVQSVYALWFLCSDFVYCILFPQLVTAMFFKKANAIGSACGLAVSFVLRFGGGEPTLGIPTLIPYPMIEDGLVLFPFRTLAMFSGLTVIVLVSLLTQKQCPAVPLQKMSEKA